MLPWAPLALTTVTAVLVALPVTPALYELWKRSDASPLPTSRHDGRIGNFADTLQTRLEPLRPQLERCRAERTCPRTSLAGMEILLVGTGDFDFDSEQTRGISTLMFGEAVQIPAGKVVDADVYADGPIALGEKAALRAAFGRDDIILGKNSTVLRWLHGDGNIYLRPGSVVYGRLSAGQSIRLERGCAFQHMHAPQILTVDSDDTRAMPASVTHSCRGAERSGRERAGAHCQAICLRRRVRGYASRVISRCRPAKRSTPMLLPPANCTSGVGHGFWAVPRVTRIRRLTRTLACTAARLRRYGVARSANVCGGSGDGGKRCSDCARRTRWLARCADYHFIVRALHRHGMPVAWDGVGARARKHRGECPDNHLDRGQVRRALNLFARLEIRSNLAGRRQRAALLQSASGRRSSFFILIPFRIPMAR